MALPRGVLLLLGLLALGAAGGAGWMLLREGPAAAEPVDTADGRVPEFVAGTGDPGGNGGKGTPAATGAGAPGGTGAVLPPDDGLDRDLFGPEGGPDVQEILDAAARGEWLEVERLLSVAGSADPRVTKLLLDGLADDRLRNHVAELARFLKDPAALAAFLEVATGEGSNLTRAAALKACSYIGGPGVLEAAGELLRSEPPGSFLSGEAAMALGRIGTPEAARQLAELLRQRAGGPYAAAAVQALGSVRSPEALAALGELALDDAGDPAFRASILRALGQTGEPGVVNDLLRASRDQEDERIRGAAYEALARIGSPEAVQELLSVVQGEDNGRRHEAALALQSTSSAAAAPLLEQALQGHVDPVLMPYLVTALGRVGSASSLEILGKIAADDSGGTGLQGTAIRAMGEIQDGKAAPVILKVFQDTPPAERSLRDQCLNALQKTATTAELPALERILEGTRTETTEWFHLKSLVERLKKEAASPGGVPGKALSK